MFSYDKLNKLCEMLTLQILDFFGPSREFSTRYIPAMYMRTVTCVHERNISPPQHLCLLYQCCRPFSLFKHRFFLGHRRCNGRPGSKNYSFSIHGVT